MRAVAKIVMDDQSQTVALPREFHFDCAEVYITQERGRMILEPVAGTAASPPATVTGVDTWEEFHALGPCPDFEIDRHDGPGDNRVCFTSDTAVRVF
jgi:virulence-associated protein VagC